MGSSETIGGADSKSPDTSDIDNIRFKKLFENSNDGLTLLDAKFRVIYRSPSAERINGWSEVERVRHTMDELIHPNYIERANLFMNEVLSAPGVSKTIHLRSRHFKGHYIWLESTFTNHLNDPDIRAIVCNFRDITERKFHEEKLTESESFIKTITDNLPAMLKPWAVKFG